MSEIVSVENSGWSNDEGAMLDENKMPFLVVDVSYYFDKRTTLFQGDEYKKGVLLFFQ